MNDVTDAHIPLAPGAHALPITLCLSALRPHANHFCSSVTMPIRSYDGDLMWSCLSFTDVYIVGGRQAARLWHYGGPLQEVQS